MRALTNGVWALTNGRAGVGVLVLFGALGCVGPGRATPGDPSPASRHVDDSDSVAVGYGMQRRRDVSGSVGSVTSRAEELDRVQQPEELLRRVPGVSVLRLSSGLYSVRVRGGGTTLSASGSGGEPLFVVDGMPRPVGPGALAGMSPQDIDRMDVLKDAAAAIYGAQAANGVILVQTKRGQRP